MTGLAEDFCAMPVANVRGVMYHFATNSGVEVCCDIAHISTFEVCEFETYTEGGKRQKHAHFPFVSST